MAALPDRDAAGAEETPVKCVCGRLLTDPVSRRRGLGPRCYERLRGRPRPGTRIVGTHTAVCHPRAVPGPPRQLALDWEAGHRPQPITDVPTGELL